MADDGRSYVDPQPIHTWFGLGRTSYFVIPRLALQSMPTAWQQRFIALMDEAEAAGLKTPSYHVLRQGDDYSREVREDEEDPYDPLDRVEVLAPDPWANYRRGDIEALSPGFKRPADGQRGEESA